MFRCSVGYAGNCSRAQLGAGDSDPSVLCTKYDSNNSAVPYWLSECAMDNKTNHSVWIDPQIHPQLGNAIRNSIAEDYNALPGVTAYETTTLSGSNRVRIFYATFEPTLPRAFTFCDEGSTTGLWNVRYHMWCRPQVIVYQATPNAVNCWNNGPCRRWLACHELGHTFGLQHSVSSETCMYTAGYPENLRAHDKGHLANCYPHPTAPLPTSPAETRTNACKSP